MNILGRLFNKIQSELDVDVSDSAIIRMAEECVERADRLGMDVEELLSDNVSITFNDDTLEIDIRQNVMLGIFWSFDCETGELVGT